MGQSELAESVGTSSLTELVWTGPRGLSVRGVTALLRGDRPVVAFTYADVDVAREVAASPRVALALSEPRSTGTAFRPQVAHGRPRLVEDPDGSVYLAELVDQELARFPPARVLADSPLLRREHWWFLPRLVVELDVDAVTPLGERRAPRDHLLVTGEERFGVHVAGVVTGSESSLTLDTDAASPDGPVDAVLFGQDASFPDLERWTQWQYRGRWDGDHLEVEQAPTRAGLAPTPGLVQRWRRQRRLERACRRSIPVS